MAEHKEFGFATGALDVRDRGPLEFCFALGVDANDLRLHRKHAGKYNTDNTE